MPGWESLMLADWLEKAIADAGQTVFGQKHGFSAEGNEKDVIFLTE
jgi:hypothetical protein